MKKIRINELARELEVKAHEILERLPEVGVSEKKTHSSSIDEDAAIRLRRLYGHDVPDYVPDESDAAEAELREVAQVEPAEGRPAGPAIAADGPLGQPIPQAQAEGPSERPQEAPAPTSRCPRGPSPAKCYRGRGSRSRRRRLKQCIPAPRPRHAPAPFHARVRRRPLRQGGRKPREKPPGPAARLRRPWRAALCRNVRWRASRRRGPWCRRVPTLPPGPPRQARSCRRSPRRRGPEFPSRMPRRFPDSRSIAVPSVPASQWSPGREFIRARLAPGGGAPPGRNTPPRSAAAGGNPVSPRLPWTTRADARATSVRCDSSGSVWRRKES